MARKRWRQSDLARALDETEAWVSRRLSGKMDLSIGELYRVAEALDVTVFDLLPRGRVTLQYLPSSTRAPRDGRPNGHPSIKRSIRVSPPLAA